MLLILQKQVSWNGVNIASPQPQTRRSILKPRNKRVAVIAAGLAALGAAAALVLNAFQSNLVFFFSSSQVAANEAPRGKAFRIGGMVEAGSLRRENDGLTVAFPCDGYRADHPGGIYGHPARSLLRG